MALHGQSTQTTLPAAGLTATNFNNEVVPHRQPIIIIQQVEGGGCCSVPPNASFAVKAVSCILLQRIRADFSAGANEQAMMDSDATENAMQNSNTKTHSSHAQSDIYENEADSNFFLSPHRALAFCNSSFVYFRCSLYRTVYLNVPM